MAFIPEDGVMPPQSMTVDHERKPVLYLPNGKVLVRQAGFTADGEGKCPTNSGQNPRSTWR